MDALNPGSFDEASDLIFEYERMLHKRNELGEREHEALSKILPRIRGLYTLRTKMRWPDNQDTPEISEPQQPFEHLIAHANKKWWQFWKR
ncbi:MAG: hypothetical protein NXH95_10890 [Pseudomonadaceae bacterium]|nr:hypothetical protein [Pseudomonadaceae bacterium]